MGDLWDDDGFGSAGAAALETDGDDDWEEGESLDTSVENGFDDPDELDDDSSGDEEGDA